MEPRVVIYRMTDDSGNVRSIMVDLLHKADPGENMARSCFLRDAIENGYTFPSHVVEREEVY